MTRQQRLELLCALGDWLKSGADEGFQAAALMAEAENPWFTQDHIAAAVNAIATQMLDANRLRNWLAAYPDHGRNHPHSTIGIVMAGNIPLVGFYDWLCVFASGRRAKVKLSDKDKRLLPQLTAWMGRAAHESWAYTEFVGDDEPLREFDAVIATGSNNTARYFEQYFAKYPHIIRRNRHGVALLTGEESAADLYALGRDVFAYFGLGCRNVSKLYVPRGYDFDLLLEALHEYRDIALHNKYKNNFDYNLTLYILNNRPYRNNGCILLVEDESLSSRIASLHYAFYDHPAEVAQSLAQIRDQIQVVATNTPLPGLPCVPFGQTQSPGLLDYPDGVDVMAFLAGLDG
ncbi:MAG: acyl-CoA reductase [Saprospiraceae bacterium]